MGANTAVILIGSTTIHLQIALGDIILYEVCGWAPELTEGKAIPLQARRVPGG
jgi:hypothetical protein